MPELKVEIFDKKSPKNEKDIQYFLKDKKLKIFLGEKPSDYELRKKLSEVDWDGCIEDNVNVLAKGFSDEQLRVIYEMILAHNYKFEKYKTEDKSNKNTGKSTKSSAQKSKNKSSSKVKKIIVKSAPNKTYKDKERETACKAIEFCRDIVNSNASEINPGKMQELAEKIAAKSSRISIKVINASQASRLGMGCLTAVGRESTENSAPDFHPRMIILEYNPAAKSKTAKSIALVGKGITYDTGGLCLKPNDYMLDMRSDMTGSAIVLSVFKALAEMSPNKKPDFKVIGVMALAENAFGGASYKPGDVLRAYNKKTVQVVDTDAEGRLVLADALSYVSEKYKPNYILDFATLTGSIVSTLGEVAAGVMSNDSKFLQEVRNAFENEGEKIWEMPLYDEYKVNLKSDIADLAHCKGRPDALVAALFLKEFVGPSISWIHFDIAGVGFIENDGIFSKKGATGFAIKSLIRYLTSH